ncbi:unnamed protein product [Moneuplotes crassus]|uniref:Uncharacterized protein n=1 Tax=Euplotes crassus TaxID=5936 RepID=A0AAD1XEB9_EUPCR|nr:unnamed protein product [Moneuplotes crassus]
METKRPNIDPQSDDEARMKVIYVDIRSLKFINPLMQEIIPITTMKKYTPYYQINFNEELLSKLEDDVKVTPEKMIYAYCNMLIHKVCPCDQYLKEETKFMYEKSLAMFEGFRKEIEGKDLLEAYYQLDKLHDYIHQIPQTTRFQSKLQEMIVEITNVISANQQKEIFCFDVTEEFKFSDEQSQPFLEAAEEEENFEENKYEGYQKLEDEPVNQKPIRSFKFPKKKIVNLNPQNKFIAQRRNAKKLEAFFDKVFAALFPILTTSWYICRTYLFPHLVALAFYSGKKLVNKIKSMEFWQNVKHKCYAFFTRVKTIAIDTKEMYLPELFASTKAAAIKFWNEDFEEYVNHAQIKQIAIKILAIVAQLILFLFILVLLFGFIFDLSPKVAPESVTQQVTTQSGEGKTVDYKLLYIQENAEKFYNQVKNLEDQKDDYIKDLKHIKTELEWVYHKLHKRERRGEKLTASDWKDLSQSIDKALNKYSHE